MKVSIIQPCFAPWLGYFEQMLIGDIFIYMDDVQYTKKDWRNRNQLKSPNGAKYITVPVKKTNRETLINEVLISYNEPWEERILNQIDQWYRKAPNYQKGRQLVENVFKMKSEKLIDLNFHLNNEILKFMGVEKEIKFSSEVPRNSVTKNERIVEICKYFKSNLLYDGNSAKKFIDQKLFANNGIEVIFQDYRQVPYSQQWGEYLPYMSILDLLLNITENYKELIITTKHPQLHSELIK